MTIGYIWELIRAKHWRREHFGRFFPQRPSVIYALMESAGFSPAHYRQAWPDLISGLPSDAYAPVHYVQFLEAEVKWQRIFPLALRREGLDRIAAATLFRPTAKASLLRNLVQSAIDCDISRVRSPSFWEDALATLSKVGRPLIVAGDSHSRLYRRTVASPRGCILPINILCGGGSASGLPRPTSRSGYGELLRAAAAAIAQASLTTKTRAPIAFNFGQVDVEFVHAYRRARRREFEIEEGEFARFRDSVVDPYVEWIASLPRAEYVVLGVNPPCVEDEFIRDAYKIQMQTYRDAGVADSVEDGATHDVWRDFDRLKLPDKRERTQLHRMFNGRLAARAEPSGLAYRDAFDALLGADGLVDPRHTFAFDGAKLSQGAHGVDIHIGGEGALQIKAALARRLLDSAPRLRSR